MGKSEKTHGLNWITTGIKHTKAESLPDFISETGHPDILILHQVNVMIRPPAKSLKNIKLSIWPGKPEIADATTGIVLDSIKEIIINKKVMMVFTSGVIIAGLWQF
jgi:hypothetical protein